MLQALPLNELNEFGRYLKTDLFNRRTILVKYLSFFSNYIKGKSNTISKETLYRKLFPEELKKFDVMSEESQVKHLRKRMDGISYELKVHLENYLIWKQSQKKGFERDSLLLEALKERRADEFYFSTFERIEPTYSVPDIQALDNHLFAYVLRQRVNEHPEFSRWNVQKADMSVIQAKLDTYYFSCKLMNAWNQILRDIVLGHPTEIPLLDEILQFASQPGYKENIYIDCYNRAIRDYKKKTYTLENGNYLIERIIPNMEFLPPDVQYGLFNLINNYFILVDHHSTEFDIAHDVRFRMAKLGLEKGYMIRKGTMSYGDFYNTLTLGIDSHELEWAENFINRYGPTLRVNIRQPSMALAMTRVKLAGKKYKEALQILSQKQIFTSEIDQLLERAFRIQCYYDLREDDLLEHLLESTRKFLARTKSVGERMKVSTQRFVKVTRQLMLARQVSDKEQVAQKIRADLMEDKAIFRLIWLLEKIDEITESNT